MAWTPSFMKISHDQRRPFMRLSVCRTVVCVCFVTAVFVFISISIFMLMSCPIQGHAYLMRRDDGIRTREELQEGTKGPRDQVIKEGRDQGSKRRKGRKEGTTDTRIPPRPINYSCPLPSALCPLPSALSPSNPMQAEKEKSERRKRRKNMKVQRGGTIAPGSCANHMSHPLPLPTSAQPETRLASLARPRIWQPTYQPPTKSYEVYFRAGRLTQD